MATIIKIIAGKDSTEALILDNAGKPCQYTNNDGKIKNIRGTSIGRKTAEQAGQSDEQIALDRLTAKLVSLGVNVEELIAGGVEIIRATATPKVNGQVKASRPTVSLASLVNGAAKISQAPAQETVKRSTLAERVDARLAAEAKQAYESAVSSANAAERTDFGLVTPASSSEEFKANACVAYEQTGRILGALAESGLEATGGPTMVNNLMESGSVGRPTIGAERRDQNGQKACDKAGLDSPFSLPLVHNSGSTADSINKRKGVAGLKTKEEDCRPVAGSLVFGRRAKNQTQEEKAANFKAFLDSPEGYDFQIGKLFEKSLLRALGNGTSLEAEQAGLALSHKIANQSVNGKGDAYTVAKILGRVVGMVERLGLGSFDELAGASETLAASATRLACLGLCLDVLDGTVSVNGQDITWHRTIVAKAHAAKVA